MMFFTVSPLALNIEPQVGSGQLRDLTELIQYFKRFLFVPFFFFTPFCELYTNLLGQG